MLKQLVKIFNIFTRDATLVDFVIVQNGAMWHIVKTLDFLVELGRLISSQSGDVRESSYLLQRISVAIQRLNSVLLQDSLTVDMPDS